jgi:hypothetical protein
MSAEDNGDDILKGISNVAAESTDTEERTSSTPDKESELVNQKLSLNKLLL